MTTRPSTPNSRSKRKGTLYCPHCGHESSADGDWIVHERGDGDLYECPDCEAVITKRPRSRHVAH